MDILENTKVKWVNCGVTQLTHVLKIANIKSCLTTIRSDDDLAFINGLTGIKISAYFSVNYCPNENLMTNPNIKYLSSTLSVANLLVIARTCKYLEINNYDDGYIREVEEFLLLPECKVTHLSISGHLNFDFVLGGQTQITKIKYWPWSSDSLQYFVNIVRGVPKLKFALPIHGAKVIDITPLLEDPAVTSIDISSAFTFDIDTLAANETLLHFGPPYKPTVATFDATNKLEHRFIKEQTKKNRKFFENKRFACTKGAETAARELTAAVHTA